MPALRRFSLFRTEVLLYLGALFVVALVVGSQVLASTTYGGYRPVIGAFAHIEQAVTHTHLLLEEYLVGDKSVDVAADIDAPLADALVDCRAILDGGATDVGEIQAVTDPATRTDVDHLCVALADLHVAATARLAAAETAREGSKLDEAFDAKFEEVLALAETSEGDIDREIDASTGQLAAVNGLVVVLVGALVIGMAVLFRRHRRVTEVKNAALVLATDESRTVLEEARREAERAEVFNRLADRVTFANGEADLLDAAVAALRRLVPTDAGDVMLLNASEDRLMVAGSWGPEAHAVGHPATVDAPGHCPGIRRGSVYMLADGTDDLAVNCAAHPVDVGSSLCVPMLALGKTVGVIHLVRSAVHGFDAASQQVAGRVAEQVALGLANARLMQTLEGLAMSDSLTGLHNARFFDPFLDRELAAAARDGHELGVVMIDVDHFKVFNDTHGHPAGDMALKAFARVVKGAVRESDTIARYGGEEFVVMVRHADLAAAAAVAENIRAAVEAALFDIGPNRTARMTVSLGVASTSHHGSDRLRLLRLADQALYGAKAAGRNRVLAAAPDVEPGGPEGEPLSRVEPTRLPSVARPA